MCVALYFSSCVGMSDMAIPIDVAELGVHHGMWGTIKKFHSGFGAYQTANNSHLAILRCAIMARTRTNVSSDESDEGAGTLERVSAEEDKRETMSMATEEVVASTGEGWLIGKTGAVVCSLHSGIIGKAFLSKDLVSEAEMY